MNKKQLKKTIESLFNVEINWPTVTFDREKPWIVNEAVNFDKEVIYVAIPKTGTHSVRSQVRQPGIPIVRHPHLDINQIRELIYIYLLEMTLGENKSF